MAKLGLSEILKRTMELPTQAEQGEYLRKNWNPSLGQLIRYAYDGVFEWDLPDGAPPYTPNEYLDQESNLYSEIRRLYIFLKGSGDHVPPSKKHLLFAGMLEAMSREDAELLIAVKDGTLPYGITQEFIIQELPGQLVSPRQPKTEEVIVTAAPTFPEPTPEPVVDAEVVVETETVTKPKAKRRTPVKRKTATKKTVARKTKTTDK
jgi:hypothetical protein